MRPLLTTLLLIAAFGAHAKDVCILKSSPVKISYSSIVKFDCTEGGAQIQGYVDGATDNNYRSPAVYTKVLIEKGYKIVDTAGENIILVKED